MNETRNSQGIGATGRSADLDLFKTLLVVGMIGAHCIQLLNVRPKPFLAVTSDVINLITFSGFLFAFGLGLGLSKSTGTKSLVQRLRPVLLLLVATYVSELAFITLVDRKALTPDLLVSLFSMTRLFGWSEFLASFFVLYLLIAIIRPVFVWIGSRWWSLGLVTLVCFASTWVTSDSGAPLVATLVGTHSFASFPLLPYLPWFLAGIYVSRHPTEPGLVAWALALAASAAFAYTLWQSGELPGRFPPTVLWVGGAALPLLVYLAIVRGLARAINIPPALIASGRHVLASLVVSNLIIFGLRRWMGGNIGAGWATLFVWLALLAIVTGWAIVLDRRQGTRSRAAA